MLYVVRDPGYSDREALVFSFLVNAMAVHVGENPLGEEVASPSPRPSPFKSGDL